MKKRKIIICSLLIIASIIGLNYKLPYTIVTVGGADDISQYVEIKDKTESEGSFSLVYVSIYSMTPANYLYTLFKEKRIDKEIYSDEDYNLGQIFKNQAHENAKINLLKLLGETDIKVDYDEFIYYTTKEATCDLTPSDEILSYDGIELKSKESYRNYLQSKELPNSIKYRLKDAEGEYKDVRCDLRELDGRKIVGYGYIDIYRVISNHADILDRITTDFSNFGGPSAGLMLTLELYDQFIDEDLTRGYEIVGTGTIAPDGSVGQIGGANFKVSAADKAGADYFFVPDNDSETSNYKVALQYKIDNNLDIEVVKINHINDALEFLWSLDYEETD